MYYKVFKNTCRKILKNGLKEYPYLVLVSYAEKGIVERKHFKNYQRLNLFLNAVIAEDTVGLSHNIHRLKAPAVNGSLKFSRF